MRKDALDAGLGVAGACCAARLRNEADALSLGYWRGNLHIQVRILDGVAMWVFSSSRTLILISSLTPSGT